MQLKVSLARQVLPWRLRGSADLEGWFEGRPWCESGGVRVVRVASPGHAARLSPIFRQTIRAIDEGVSDPRFLELDRSSGEGTIDREVARALAIPGDSWTIDWMRRLAAEIRIRPAIALCLPASTEHPVQPWLPEAQRLVDLIAKHVRQNGLVVLLLDARPGFEGPEADDWTVGAPAASLLDGLWGPQELLWTRYVHHRLAWEAGGDLELAESWDGGAGPPLRCGDDRALEERLNRHARETLKSLPPSVVDAVREHLDSVSGVQSRRSASDPLGRTELHLRLPGERTGRLVPWVARAGLLEGWSAGRAYLRGCLVCAPLARELIGRCLDMEAQVRAGSQPAPDAVPSIEIDARFQAFRDRQRHTAAPHYPAGHPAVPADPWAVATFGEFLRVLTVPEPLRGTLSALRDLRNSVSHGHYVSWESVIQLREIERRLGAWRIPGLPDSC